MDPVIHDNGGEFPRDVVVPGTPTSRNLPRNGGKQTRSGDLNNARAQLNILTTLLSGTPAYLFILSCAIYRTVPGLSFIPRV